MILVTILTVQLIKVPTFMLPFEFVTIGLIIALLIGSSIIAGAIKLIFKRISFFVALCTIVSIVSLVFIFKFLSSELTIVVPKGYVGQIALVLSNADENILTIDSNGIGYINKETFDKTYAKPIVLETDGKDISNQCVGYNPSTFWGKGTSSTVTTASNSKSKEIRFLCFEVVPKGKIGQKQYYSIDLTKLVDEAKLYQKK